MVERLHFLVVYVGSAALVAFVAACLTSPQVAAYGCSSAGAAGDGPCELAATVAAFAAVAGEINPEDLAAQVQAVSQEPLTTAGSN
ncbi:hypothetical protein BH11PSE8_BH11PSE8_23180 [soil metagenome]